MGSIKSLTLLTMSITAATAVPQYGHARFHPRGTGTGVDQIPLPTGGHHHHHHHNETESDPVADSPHNAVSKQQTSSCSGSSTHTEYVTSTSVATVTAERRWDRTVTYTWDGQNGQNTWVPAAAASAVASIVPIASNTPAYSATASASAAASSGVTTSASTGGKKGLAYNSAGLLTQFSGASWAYNWGSTAGGTMPSGVEYVPMLWGSNDIGAWSGAVNAAISNGATHVLSFNEPDFPQQANIPAPQAAQLHKDNVANLSGKVKVGSPAITNSNIAGQGLDWMNAFLSACGGEANNCKLDFLAFHWYNNLGTMDDFKSHVSSVVSLAKQNNVPKVWLTEFAVNGGINDQAAFLQEAIPFLDSFAEVERYAYFMVGNGHMLTNGALNIVGKAFVG